MNSLLGISEAHFQTLEQIVLKPLWSVAGTRIWVFGSRARGQARPFSDIDLLVEAGGPLPDLQLSGIRAEIEESSLPYKVDLVRWEDLAEGYRKQVMEERKEIPKSLA